MDESIIGIDISKQKFDATIFLKDGKQRHRVFSNIKEGFEQLKKWLEYLGVKEAHCCMEATGCYGDPLAFFMHEKGYKVSIVNPARIKAYAKSEGARTKTDKVDSQIIARFCKAHRPLLWAPLSPAEQQLKELYRCLQSIQEDRGRLSNRLEKIGKKTTFISKVWQDLLMLVEQKKKDVESQIYDLLQNNKELRVQVDLLKTIPGVKDKTAVAILSELPNIKNFKNAKEAAAFAGLTPYVRQSGTSLRGKGVLSKVGSPQLRKALYMPAIVAKNHNPLLKEFSARLSKKGKHSMTIIAAVMRKLLHIIFGVLKTQKPFTSSLKGA